LRIADVHSADLSGEGEGEGRGVRRARAARRRVGGRGAHSWSR